MLNNQAIVLSILIFVCFLQLLEEIDKFTVVQRDGSIIACAALFPFYDEKCGEVAALAVAPECRGHGQGDKLLGMCGPQSQCLLWIITIWGLH